jgi:hypothetical protein
VPHAPIKTGTNALVAVSINETTPISRLPQPGSVDPQIAYLAIEYGIDTESELPKVIPPKPRDDVAPERACG